MGTPVIRGSGIQASSTSSAVVTFPSGSVAGDLALIFGGTAYNVSAVPTGWAAPLGIMDGGDIWKPFFVYKVLSSSDISTGSVTVAITGAYDVVFGIVTFVGNPGPV